MPDRKEPDRKTVDVAVHIDKHLQLSEADSVLPTVVTMIRAFYPFSDDHPHVDPDHNAADVVEYQF